MNTDNNIIILQGYICLHSLDEATDILFLHSIEPQLSQKLYHLIHNKTVTARYWITDKETTKEQAQEMFIKKLFGEAECEYGSEYSEITGYLWTDDKCKIGGHDLIEELKSYVGKYLILEIEIHEDKL